MAERRTARTPPRRSSRTTTRRARQKPDLAALSAPGHPGAARDPETIRRYQPLLELYAAYYRPEVRGFDRLPANGPFLVVGNHSGGGAPPDMPILLTRWWRERSVEEPVYGLFHSFFIGLPGFRSVLTRFGALEAGWDAAGAVLDAGGIVLVYPGGDHEAFRPWRERNRIDLAGRTGFIKLALRSRVPIVTAVSIGVQDSIFVVTRGERLARALPHLKRWRLKVQPVVLGLPWIVSLGLPTIPLPTRATVELSKPIDLSSRYGPGAADDDRVVRRLYDEIERGMQRTLDALARERSGVGR